MPDSYRLPRTVTPERYELTLTPDLDAATFAGEERVRLRVNEATQEIVLNAVELDIISADLTNDAGDRVGGEVSLDADAGRATIALEHEITPGLWTLQLTFAGVLNDKLAGFYRSTYTDDSGTQRVIATTQFESTDARRAFPCWDEPDLKAVFTITLIIDNGLTAFSNASIREETRLANGKRQVEFDDTMKMSTYIVAFIVGPLAATEAVDVDGVPLRIACVPGREHLTPFALESGAAALRFFTNYFGIPYPGEKLDLIALPDFAAGAMENLGCVTFRETALLVDTDRASRLEMQRVADVVGHEIAHMWFGDLVTMKWWNGLWLNEAFATFMEMLFVDDFRPEWQRWVSFGLGRSAAMDLDALNATRPIEFTVNSPTDAAEMFDVLTYEKGAGVLRMLEQHIGPDVFRGGISDYLKEHAYGNAETTDLWDALDRVSDQPVRAMMDSWIFQGGHPVVRAETNGNELSLGQQRFLFVDNGDHDALWHIPVGIRTTGHHKRVLLSEEHRTVSLPEDANWVVVNAHSHGFFPVAYSPEMLGKLTADVDQLDALERFALVNDTWNACLADQTDLADVISMAELMKKDDDPNVWGVLVSPLRMIDHVLDDSDRPRLQAFARKIARPGFERLGWERRDGESDQTATLRATLMGTMGGLGADADVRQEAGERFVRYQSDASALDADLVTTTQLVLATTNDREHYELLLQRFTNEASSPQNKIVALMALASFTDEALVDRTLGMVESEQIRSQDAPYAVRMMLTKRKTGAVAWTWCEEHWDMMLTRFPDNSIDRMIDGVTAQANPALIARVDDFLATHPIPQATKAVDQIRERMQVNVAFHDRYAKTAADMLG